jgi:hypothetical protein
MSPPKQQKQAHQMSYPQISRRNRPMSKASHAFDFLNRMASEIILAERERYAGLPVMWAEMWQAGHPARRQNAVTAAGAKQAPSPFVDKIHPIQ